MVGALLSTILFTNQDVHADSVRGTTLGYSHERSDLGIEKSKFRR